MMILFQEIEVKIDKICEMAVVMQQAIKLDEDHSTEADSTITQLKFENQTLRELLKISNDSGSLCDFDKVEQVMTAGHCVTSIK